MLTYDHPGHGASALPEQPLHRRGVRPRPARTPRRARARARLGLRRLARRDGRDGARARSAGACRAARPRLHVRLPRTARRLDRARARRSRRRHGGDRRRRRRALVHARARSASEPETVARFRAMLVGTPPEGYARCCEALAVLGRARADLRDRRAALVDRRRRRPGDAGRARRASSRPASRTRDFASSSARPTSRTSSAPRSSRAPCSDHLGQEVPV